MLLLMIRRRGAWPSSRLRAQSIHSAGRGSWSKCLRTQLSCAWCGTIYHLCSWYPRVSNASFYQEKAYVCLKDKLTQPPLPLRHSTKLASLLLKHYSDDGLVLTKPVLVVVSDGGPDHWTHLYRWLYFFCLYPLTQTCLWLPTLVHISLGKILLKELYQH